MIASIILFHKIVTNSTYHQNITAIEHNGEGENSCIKEFLREIGTPKQPQQVHFPGHFFLFFRNRQQNDMASY